MRPVLTSLVAALLLTACGGDEPTAAPTPDPVAAAAAAIEEALGLPGDPVAGAEVYKIYCEACHQADGTGMMGMLGADFVNDKTRLAKPNAALMYAIENGVEGTMMEAMGAKVPEQDQKDVISYIRKTFGDPRP